MKGPGGTEELAEAANAIKTLGGETAEVKERVLPSGERRSIIYIKKTRPTPAAYPRRAAEQRKKPL
jgi:16S rRNA (guanine527-N7)-methyltransferase